MTTRFADAQTIQSAGAFLQGELERLDPKLYEPLSDFTWGRDMPVRSDVSVADEFTSFMTSEFAGGFSGTGNGTKSWIHDKDTTPAQVALKFGKTLSPLTPWGMELAYSIFELQKAQQVGRPIDEQKFNALRTKHQLDIDAMVYVGDTEIGQTGLLNNASVASGNVGAISASSTPDAVLDAFNTALDTAWKNANYVRIPNKCLVPPEVFSILVSTQLPNTNMNLMQFLLANNIASANGAKLEIAPCKWLSTTLPGAVIATPKIVAYIQDPDYIRFPLVELQSLPMQYRDFNQVVPYYAALGVVEFVRPETVYYGVLADS